MVGMGETADSYPQVRELLVACPGCARQLRGEIGTTAVTLGCPGCGLCFLARRPDLAVDDWLQIKLPTAQADSFYQLLDVAADADGAAIKAAYWREARRWHPDRNKNSEESARRFQAIAQAFEVLSDRQRRAAYDTEQVLVPSSWRRWPAVREFDTCGDRATERTRLRGRWRLVLRYLAIGLALGVGAGLFLPRDSRFLKPLFASVALVGLVRLALMWRRSVRP